MIGAALFALAIIGGAAFICWILGIVISAVAYRERPEPSRYGVAHGDWPIIPTVQTPVHDAEQ